MNNKNNDRDKNKNPENKVPLLQVVKLSTTLQTKEGPLTPIKDVSFTLFPGQTLALLGESGSGKSLTAHSILQLLPRNAEHSRESQIIFRGEDILSLPEIRLKKIRGKDIAMIFQEPMTSLNPILRVHEQIEEVFAIHRELPRSSYRSEVLKLLEAVKIQGAGRVFRAYPHELSGGMRQRVMIAMALAGNPKILIADEPTTALDVITQAKILTLLKQIQAELGMSLLFITHDLRVAAKISDEILVMKGGIVIEQEKTPLLLQHPKHPYTKHLFSVAPKHTLSPLKNDSPPILSVNNLSVFFPVKRGFFKPKEVVRSVEAVSFEIRSGETLALVGESGSGKTTLAKAVMALIPPTQGTIYLLNDPITSYSENKLRQKRREFQIIFQDPFSSLNPRMRVIDILEEGLLALKLGLKADQRLERIDSLLDQVGLHRDSKYRYPHQFSGGERQRLCIARALSVFPKLIVCDEPTSSLDASLAAEILDLLLQLQKKYALSYLFITHNIAIVKTIAHRMMVMHEGKMVESGETKKLLMSPEHPYTKELLASTL